MAMTLLNDSSVALSLGELNKNITKVGKALTKLSTGQRITGASVDTASFAISEKMREQLRSLDQDIQNVQNGSAMLKTAHGGIENIVDELRHLKELAIDAANDSNTDDDRAIIQKEFDQRRANIDEIAQWTTYNTKPLLDGKYVRANSSTTSAVSIDTGAVENGKVYVDRVTDLFDLDTTTMRGKEAPSVSWVNGREAYGPVEEYEWIPLDFSDVSAKEGSFSMPSSMNQQGFSILCSDYPGCPSFHGFMFDTSMNVGTGEKRVNTSGPFYVVGIKGLKSTEDLAKALFDGVKNAIQKDTSSGGEHVNGNTIYLDGYGDEVDIRDNGDGTYSIMQHYAMWIYEGYDLNAAHENPNASTSTPYNPLTIHHGPHSNQATNFFINDMRTKALKGTIPNEKDKADLAHLSGDRDKQEALMNFLYEAKSMTLNEVSVRTQYDANVAIRVIDGAIDYALDEATYLGSYLQRLDYTELNVVKMDENIQGAESTIRDADMAKEMTEYTKQNVLSQAAQSMLAQANQNMSNVLSLLQ